MSCSSYCQRRPPFAALVGSALLLSVGTVAPQAHAGNPAHLYEAGLQACQMQNFDAARGFFEEAMHLAPAWSLPQIELGVSWLGLNNAAEAETVLLRASKLSNNNPRAFYQLGLAAARQEHTDIAHGAFMAASRLRPQWDAPWLQLADLQLAQGHTRAALDALLSARQANPRSEGAITRSALLYEDLHEFTKAEEAWWALVQSNPRVAYNYYALAKFYERQNKPAQAQHAFARATALDPRPVRKMRPLRK